MKSGFQSIFNFPLNLPFLLGNIPLETVDSDFGVDAWYSLMLLLSYMAFYWKLKRMYCYVTFYKLY